MLANLTIAQKLLAGFAVILLVIAALTLSTSRSLTAIDTNVELNVHTYRVIERARELLSSLINIETGMRGYALTGTESFLAPLTAGKQAYLELHAELSELTSDNADQQRRMAEIEGIYQRWISEDIDMLIDMRTRQNQGEALPEALTSRINEARDREKMDNMRALIAEFISAERVLLEQRRSAMASSQTRAMMVLILGGVIAAVFAVLIAVGLSRNISGRLSKVVAVAKQIADGRLDTRLDNSGNDEIAQLSGAFVAMQNRLRAMIGEIGTGSERLLTSSEQISSASAQLSAATREQAQAAATMAATVEQLTVSISHVAESAKEAHSISSDAGRHSEEGGEVIQRTLESMRQIADTVQGSSVKISELENHSVQITSIIKVIQEIADQTNLLALNAAIEAARAGEQGRGFAVVADEVRLLSQRTSTSTKEIADMIRKIQQGTQEAVSHMKIGVEQVNSGVSLASKAGEAIVQIREGAVRVVNVVDQISSALRDQDSASQDVGRNVEHIAHMSEENSQAVSETTATAQDLQHLASDLRKQVSQFTL